MSRPVDTPSILAALSKASLVRLGRVLDIHVDADARKEDQMRILTGASGVDPGELLRALSRDELRAICRAHDLDDAGRSRADLARRILDAAGAAAPTGLERFEGAGIRRTVPEAGDVVLARQRQYLVEQVSPVPGQATAVSLVGLDDDNQGRRTTVLWELELGARIVKPEDEGLGEVASLDPPSRFAAYLNALKWNQVTASETRLFQAPYRAGIKILDLQLEPLRKALELPRANLFIADDVGLGKTIEAGLILQELRLRQRVDFTLIVCPAAVALQWRDEMQKRFGLRFEIYNREFVGRRRQERGFGVNAWSTHTRFIISYQTLRRPEYRDPLLHHLGERVRKSLLILDEAHTVAPASASRYAVDSQVTGVIRDVAPRFENRLFLSATPHNGHSNSFSALLELLDPQRFTRGVPVESVDELEPVLVRRLKSDLRKLGSREFPLRRVVQVALTNHGGAWTARYAESTAEDPKPRETLVAEVGEGKPVELELSELLRRYRDLMAPTTRRGRLVFVRLQNRLLSSIEAFHRTLGKHIQAVDRALAAADVQPAGQAAHRGSEAASPTSSSESKVSNRAEGREFGLESVQPVGHEDASPQAELLPEEYGDDDDVTEREAAEALERDTAAHVPPPEAVARELLERLRDLAARHRNAPDARVLALVDWIRRRLCDGAAIGGSTVKNAAWNERRLLIFTESGDTQRYLMRILNAAVAGTDRAEERIDWFRGGMPDDRRDAIQQAFNAPPSEHPLRILVATDAAREGVNLQGHCADLFHFDIPWNPARMEQRNGRIDRAMQPEPEVRCHYFTYPDRSEDIVLRKVVDKIEVIREELGSLSQVVMDRMEAALELGIDAEAEARIDAASELGDRTQTTQRELEDGRRLDALREQQDAARDILQESKDFLEFEPEPLRRLIDVGLTLAGAGRLAPAPEAGPDAAAGAARTHQAGWTLPELSGDWTETLDTLRPPRGRDEPFWEWRKRAPLPVVFRAPDRLDSTRVHLHLEHPFTQRILSRFRAQGYSAHDLSRVTVLANPHDAAARVAAFARLSLFGRGAARLHDRILVVAAPWLESGKGDHLKPLGPKPSQRVQDRLAELLHEAGDALQVPDPVQTKLKTAAANDFAALWPHLKAEADAMAHEVEDRLTARGAEEAAALRDILNRQRAAIERTLRDTQLELDFAKEIRAADQERQFKEDRRYMEQRLAAIDEELRTDPEQLRTLYTVVFSRLQPAGIVYLWPAA